MRVQLVEIENNLVVVSSKGTTKGVNMYKVTFECPISKLTGSIKVVADSHNQAIANMHKAFKRRYVPIQLEVLFIKPTSLASSKALV